MSDNIDDTISKISTCCATKGKLCLLNRLSEIAEDKECMADPCCKKYLEQLIDKLTQELRSEEV